MLEYDTGDHGATLEKALEVSRWSTFSARREEGARRGELRGIGIVTYIEACGAGALADCVATRPGGLFKRAVATSRC
jgi:aerobic carbon-monoxide dehydrogenase large subunit